MSTLLRFPHCAKYFSSEFLSMLFPISPMYNLNRLSVSVLEKFPAFELEESVATDGFNGLSEMGLSELELTVAAEMD
jgi:hypothetical protein